MTFEQQIEALAGLTISSSGTTPTQDEVTQFLKNGVIDVINKMIEVSPSEVVKFTTTSEDEENLGVTIIGQPISIVREHDSASILRPCTLIQANDRYEATDIDSLKYRSKYNPAYYVLDGKIYSIPASATSNNAMIVTQISYSEPLYSDSSIDNFPNEYEYLVVQYAAMKSLEAKMAEYTIDEEDVELTQGLAINFTALSKQYDSAFMLKAPKQQAQQGEL